MAADNASTNIQREAPFLEDYRRRLMDSVFAATKESIVPGERDIAGYDPFQTTGFDSNFFMPKSSAAFILVLAILV